MDWVRDFYTKQNVWGEGVYDREISSEDRKRAASVAACLERKTGRVLELGAGGGQTCAALADLGFHATALELLPLPIAQAQTFAEEARMGTMTVIAGDFYDVDPESDFDLVGYWDGFGVGTDEDQRRLLKRIAAWLKPEGCALIEVGTPWYWVNAAGQGWQVGQALRRYGFDPVECRMLDTWWPIDDESQAITQSIRCYSPADFKLLLQGTGLKLQSFTPTGAVDYQAKTYREQAPLEEAMGYVAILLLDD